MLRISEFMDFVQLPEFPVTRKHNVLEIGFVSNNLNLNLATRVNHIK
jgi:hypothetical protein